MQTEQTTAMSTISQAIMREIIAHAPEPMREGVRQLLNAKTERMTISEQYTWLQRRGFINQKN